MDILLSHTASEFKKNEVKTLEYIKNWGFFDSEFVDLAAAINTAHAKYGYLKKAFDFHFTSDFTMIIEKKEHRIVLHAEVSGDYTLTTYSLGICGIGDSLELIRRFHFDYVHKNQGKKQKVPVSHIQYGGKSGIGSDGKIFLTNNIEHWLSVPRINFPPINLALLLDLVLCEFTEENTKKIVEDPNWRALIKDNETFLLKNYYKTIANYVDSTLHTKKTLVRDILYGS